MTAPDFPRRWIEAGLFDPAGADATERLEVLEWLEAIGVDPAEFAGVDPDGLMRAVNERMLRPGPRLSGAEACRLSGLSPDLFEQVCRAAGYTMDGEFTELDVEAFKAFGAGIGLFSTQELLHFSRVLQSSMARVADASTSLFRIDVAPALEARGGTMLEWAQTNREAASLIQAVFMPLRAFLLHELEQSVRRSDRGRELVGSTDSASTLRLAIGFVDLVGFTPFADALPPDELARFVQGFEDQAYDIVAANRGRLVKLIGDEVMFVTVDPTDACVIAAELISGFDSVEAAPRGGIATGDVVAQGGDYYGRTVNVAARIADLAVSGEVLVDEGTAAAVTDFAFDPAGRRQLKGFPDPLPLLSLGPPT